MHDFGLLFSSKTKIQSPPVFRESNGNGAVWLEFVKHSLRGGDLSSASRGHEDDKELQSGISHSNSASGHCLDAT